MLNKYLTYRRTKHGITILYHLHHDIFRAKVGKMGIFINIKLLNVYRLDPDQLASGWYNYFIPPTS